MWIISFREGLTYNNLYDCGTQDDYIWAVGRTKKECEQNWVDRTRDNNLPNGQRGYYSQFKTVYQYNRHEKIFHENRNPFFIYEV